MDDKGIFVSTKALALILGSLAGLAATTLALIKVVLERTCV